MPPDETTGDGAAWGALPLVQEGRSLRVGAGGHGGLPLLDGMPSSISVAKEEGDIVVLGAASADGPAALADFALGQVSGSC